MEKSTKKSKVSEASETELLKAGFYKSYDIRWLREIPEHPDFHLVAEHDALVSKSK